MFQVIHSKMASLDDKIAVLEAEIEGYISPTVTKKDAPGHPFLDPCYDDNYASNR